MLLAGLPPDSRTAIALNPADDGPPWTRADHLLAGIYDTVNILAWQNANEGRKTATKRPKPLPRPGIGDDKAEGVRWGAPVPLSEVKSILAASAPGGGD